MYAKRPAEDYRGPAFLLTALARLLLMTSDTIILSNVIARDGEELNCSYGDARG